MIKIELENYGKIQEELDAVQKRVRKRKIDTDYIFTVVKGLEELFGDDLEGLKITVFPGEKIEGYDRNAKSRWQQPYIQQQCTIFTLTWKSDGVYIDGIRRSYKPPFKVGIKELPKNANPALKKLFDSPMIDFGRRRKEDI